MSSKKVLLVGDNPFHNISHLSQERTRTRDRATLRPENAADLVRISVENGANGFMFSVSETTLSVLEALRHQEETDRLSLYAIVPYAYEYVRLATQLGGIPGLAKRLARQVISQGNARVLVRGLQGAVTIDVISLMKAYLMYEIGRIKSSAGKGAVIESIILHEVITDMCLALNMDWFFKGYMDFMRRLKIRPGFNSCNFAYLIRKLNEWDLNSKGVVIATPFNKIGFQMNPSRTECEIALGKAASATVIAISVLAAGYLTPSDAIDYIASLPAMGGVAIGVSKEKHARETFSLLRQRLASNARALAK